MRNLDSIWKKAIRDQQGFTLVEMLVAVVVALIIMAGVTAVFVSHSHHYTQQDDLSILQQDLRSLLMIVPADIRLAGCDPLEKGKARILKAEALEIVFTADIASKNNSKYPNESDGEVDAAGERVGYRFNEDNGILYRTVQGKNGKMSGWQPMFENIEHLEFNYILDNNQSTLKANKNQLNKKQIKAVQLSVLARAQNPTTGGYTHAGSFKSGSGETWTVPQDGHRRRLVVTTIQLRNMAY